jgi:hypothetical protein
VIYALLPALIPLLISTLLVYLPFGAYYSRARIRLLEKDESNSRTLVNILAELERNVEDAVVDIIDNPGLPKSASVSLSELKAPSGKSVLTPSQQQIAASLNTLPIKKHLAYIENVLNSHALIVCRDVSRFEIHRVGEGVVRHWATSFIL